MPECNAPDRYTCHEIHSTETWEEIAEQYGLLPRDRGGVFLQQLNQNFGIGLGAEGRAVDASGMPTSTVFIPVFAEDVYIVPNDLAGSAGASYRPAYADEFGEQENLTFVRQLPIPVTGYSDGLYFLGEPFGRSATREELEVLSQFDPDQAATRWLISFYNHDASLDTYYNALLQPDSSGSVAQAERQFQEALIDNVVRLFPIGESNFWGQEISPEEVEAEIRRALRSGDLTTEGLALYAYQLSSNSLTNIQHLSTTMPYDISQLPYTVETLPHIPYGPLDEHFADNFGAFGGLSFRQRSAFSGFLGEEAAYAQHTQAFVSNYLTAAQLDTYRQQIESWNLDRQADLLRQLDAAIDRIPNAVVLIPGVLLIPTAHIGEAFRRFHDAATVNYLAMRAFERVIASREERFYASLEQNERFLDLPPGLEILLSAVFEPVDWALILRDVVLYKDATALIGLIPFIPAASRRLGDLIGELGQSLDEVAAGFRGGFDWGLAGGNQRQLVWSGDSGNRGGGNALFSSIPEGSSGRTPNPEEIGNLGDDTSIPYPWTPVNFDVEVYLRSLGETDPQAQENILFRASSVPDPRNRSRMLQPPSPELFAGRLVMVRAGDLENVIGERANAILEIQAAAVARLNNEELTMFRHNEPISGFIMGNNQQISLTGGHHRTNEIINRVASGDLDADTLVYILIHHP